MIPNTKFVRLVSIDEDINLSAQMEPISCGILPYDPSYTSQQYHIFFQIWGSVRKPAGVRDQQTPWRSRTTRTPAVSSASMDG